MELLIKVFDQAFFNMLYQWHTQDPVSQREIDRNNAIYDYQSNRNPFIDNPEYVDEIWVNVLSVDDFTLPMTLTFIQTQ